MNKSFAAAAAVLVVSGAAHAFQAAPPPNPQPGPRAGAGAFRGGRATGVITAVNGTTYTIRNMRGVEVKATITPETPVTKPDRSTGAIADLKVGVFVNVQGQPDATGAVQATRVMVQNPMVMGTVQSITASRISVKGMDGKTATFLIDAKTTMMNRRQPAKWTDYKIGDRVTVQYQGARALTIRAGAMAGGMGGGARRGPRNNGTGAPPPPPPPAPPVAPGQ